MTDPRGARVRWRALFVLLLALVPLQAASPAQAAEDGARQSAAPFRVKSTEGEKLELAALLAKGPVLLDFWATWCKPCLVSLPELQALHETYAERGLTVLGVSIDGPRNFAKVRPFAKRVGLTYPIVLDEDGLMQRRFQVRAVPTTVLIAPDGSIEHVVTGYRPGEIEALGEAIERLLADEATAGP